MHTYFYFEGMVIASVDQCLAETDCYLTASNLAWSVGCDPADILWSAGENYGYIF